MSDTFNFTYDSAISASFQGQLSSSYSAFVAGEVQESADYIGYLVYLKTGNVADGIAAEAAVEAGLFTVKDLFGAAQSKTGAVLGSAITDPSPKVVVNGIEVSIVDMLGRLDTETWTTTTKVGKTTETIYHTREFYSTSDVPEYNENWDVVNSAPTAVAITRDLVEDGVGQDTDIDLLVDANAADPDIGDVVSIVPDSYTFKLDGADATLADVSAYISIINGKVTFLDTTLDLLMGQQLTIEIGYKITDGDAEIDNTATITYTGTVDKYSGSASVTVTKGTSSAAGDTFAGSFDLEGFDFSNFVGTFSAYGDFDRTNETVNLTGGVTSTTLGGTSSSGPNPELLDDSKGPVAVTVTTSGLSDGDIDYIFTFSNNVADGSTATLSVTYDYFA